MRPIRIFVGCAANNEDLESQAVLEYSIRHNTGRNISITWMQLEASSDSVFSGWEISDWTTPFSGFRWAVPELCNFSGQAIYMDSDVIVRGDVGELWDREIEVGKIVIAVGPKHPQRLCVSKWDCAKAKYFLPRIKDIKSDPTSHRFLMKKIAANPNLVQPFGNLGNWNALDLNGEVWNKDVRAIHYTGIPTHLGLKHSVPRLKAENKSHWFGGTPRSHPDQKLQKLFDDLLVEATAAGFGIENYRRSPFGKYGLKYGT